MITHQIWNSTGNVYNAFVYHRTHYPVHFHKSFELIYPIKGEMDAVVDRRSYHIGVGECLLVPPFVSHSIDVVEGNACLVVVFSTRYAESATKLFAKGVPRGHLLRVPGAHEGLIREVLVGATDTDSAMTVALHRPPLLRLKACLYLLFDDFISQNPIEERSTDGELAARMLAYLEEHYTSDLSLSDMAQKLGYSYDYLSRVFHQSFRVRFKVILNQYRCEHAMHLLLTTQKPLSEISMDSGFQSIRSFNRVFIETVGKTPSEFRQSNR
jgi:AraC-like DNA-binding protein